MFIFLLVSNWKQARAIRHTVVGSSSYRSQIAIVVTAIQPFLANPAVAKILAGFENRCSRRICKLFTAESNETCLGLSAFESFDGLM